MENVIPRWAAQIPKNYRRNLNIPENVSDEEIFKLYEECVGMNEEDIVKAMKEEFIDKHP